MKLEGIRAYILVLSPEISFGAKIPGRDMSHLSAQSSALLARPVSNLESAIWRSLAVPLWTKRTSSRVWMPAEF